MVAALESIENLRGICKAGIKFQIEIEGQRKPALEGVATFFILLCISWKILSEESIFSYLNKVQTYGKSRHLTERIYFLFGGKIVCKDDKQKNFDEPNNWFIEVFLLV